MGSHHDNFFLWNSKLHRWNAVNMGPQRDVVGEWQKAAKSRFEIRRFRNTWAPASPGSSPATAPTRKAPRPACLMMAPTLNIKISTISLLTLTTRAGTPKTHAGNSSGTTQSRSWSTTTIPDLLYTDGGVPFGNVVVTA